MFIWFGMLPFIVKPLTLVQIWDIGAISKDMPEVEQEKIDKLNAVSATLLYSGEAKKMADIAVLTMLRSVLMRWLFGSYIKKRLTIRKYKRLQDYMANTMDASFFLSTIIFLKGLNETTKTTNIAEVIVPGQQLVE